MNFVGVAMFCFMWLQLHLRWIKNNNPWHVAYFIAYMVAATVLILWRNAP